MSYLRLLVYLRSFIDHLIQKELKNMPTLYTHLLHILCPSDGGALGALTLCCEVVLGNGVGSFGMSRRAAPTPQSGQTHWYSSEVFTEQQMEILRIRCSPGGDLYLLGVRMRRKFNAAIETTSNEAGKQQVTVYGVGDTIPGDVDWETGRVSVDRFLADSSVVILEDDFLP